MNSLLTSTRSLMELFNGKLEEFASNVESVHMVWLEEIQQEANRMFSSDFSAEPELMPKTPSQKKSSRRKRISLGRDENNCKRRFSKGKRSNLRRSSVQTLQLIAEDEGVLGANALPEEVPEEMQPKRNTRRNNKQKLEETAKEAEIPKNSSRKPVQNSCQEQEEGPTKPRKDGLIQTEPCPETQEDMKQQQQEVAAVGVLKGEPTSSAPQTPSTADTTPERAIAVVEIPATERLSADLLQEKMSSQCRTATKLAIARSPETHVTAVGPRRSSVQRSLVLRRSLAGLRHSMTQESVRRASRRSFLKKKAQMSSSTCSSNASGGLCVEMEENAEEGMEGLLAEHSAETEMDLPPPKEEEEKKAEPSSSEDVRRFTRSMAQTTTPTSACPVPLLRTEKDSTPASSSDDSGKKTLTTSSSLRSNSSNKRRAAEAAEELVSPRKKSSPPTKSQSAVRPNMKSFLHTVQKNQLLMMTPGSLGRNAVVKSFIKHTTPLRVDLKERERLRLEALKKKQEQEIERKKKMEEEKRRKQEEMKRKRDERLRKVVEARVKEEQKEEEKKKKIEMKLAQMEEKNDKLRVERLAEEKAKKKVATKRQEELEQRRKQEEEARRKKIQQAEEEERRQQELLAKRRAEEEQERARRLAEARRALELKKEQERERELEREKERERERLRQQEAAERERVEREKALALQRELEKAAREKELRDAEERKKKEEQQRRAEQEKAAAVAAAAKTVTLEVQKSLMKTPVGKGTGLNVTMDVERSPQSYEITPKGGNKPLVINTNPEDYGMDQNSDDSTDDESAPRKPIPSWAEGRQLQQTMLHQYFNPVDVDSFFGEIEEPKLERIFYKSKPRYFKRTSSAVWQSPPRAGTTAF